MNARQFCMTATMSLALFACTGETTVNNEVQTSGGTPFQITEVATFASPWAFAFLPDGNILVSEKQGTLILLDPQSGSKQTVGGTPAVKSEGQGSLMDIALAPDFATSNKLYFTFSEAGEGARSGLALATGTLNRSGTAALNDVRVIFRADGNSDKGGHYSGRIAFAPDNQTMFLTSGDRQLMDPAQDPKSLLGKVLRLNLDGTPAAGNPLAAQGFHPAIWSYGHRNLLGIAFDAQGQLWEMEMGPAHGDEINLIKPGLNYGWPKASMGNHYDGKAIPDHTAGDGFEAPKVHWVPAISPGGLAYYNADLFPQWKNSLFITGLSGKSLDRIAIDGENATKADHWDMGERIRAVRTGPDGALWLLEDGESGRLLRLSPSE
jgi:glucose/arabinose dehydrogenase